jgi:nitroreductase
MDVIEAIKLRREIGIPDNQRVIAVLGLGYPMEKPAPKGKYPRDSVVHYEAYKLDS